MGTGTIEPPMPPRAPGIAAPTPPRAASSVPPAPPEPPARSTSQPTPQADVPLRAAGRSLPARPVQPGTLITEIHICRDRTLFISPEAVPVRGSVATDLRDGVYLLRVDRRNRRWVFEDRQVPSGLRFHVSLEGIADPFDLTYPDTLPLVAGEMDLAGQEDGFASLVARIVEMVEVDARILDAYVALDGLSDVDLHDLLNEVQLGHPAVLDLLVIGYRQARDSPRVSDPARVLYAAERLALPAENFYIDAFDTCSIHPATYAAPPEPLPPGIGNVHLVFSYGLPVDRAIIILADTILDDLETFGGQRRFEENGLLYPPMATEGTTPRMHAAKLEKLAEIQGKVLLEMVELSANTSMRLILETMNASSMLGRTLGSAAARSILARSGARTPLSQAARTNPITNARGRIAGRWIDAFDEAGSVGAAKLSRSFQPGRWIRDFEGGLNMSKEQAAYQARVCGSRRGFGYYVRATQFDGFDGTRLLDAKYWVNGGTMARALKARQVWSFFRVMGSANRQLKAARGQPVQWILAGEDAAGEIRRLFALYKIPIDVVVRQ